MFIYLPCIDSDELANANREDLSIPREIAQQLGASAVVASRSGQYFDDKGLAVDWSDAVNDAIRLKVSIPPGQELSFREASVFDQTIVQVTNETTLKAAKRFHEKGKKPLALNFANGIHPGGGFLNGARAQEESICRSSALFVTLENDQMYLAHRNRPLPDSTDWAIYSPDVPVFRTDNGRSLDAPWYLSVLTSAAPVATRMDQSVAATLLAKRIQRVLAISHSLGYENLILGAWGCGAFANDPLQTARNFKDALDENFPHAFSEIVFAITDWSIERRFLGPFRDVFV